MTDRSRHATAPTAPTAAPPGPPGPPGAPASPAILAVKATAPAAARSRRGHGRITLQEVALAAGVTKVTVSRYLREPGRVAAETAGRIAQALTSTGYVPNKQAGMLASGRSGVVAAIVPSLANSVFAETVQGLSDGLQPAGLELMLASSGYSLQREQAQIRAVLGWSPDALAVTGRHHTPEALAMLRAAVRAGTPIIELWDCEPQGAEFVQIGFDHAEVGRAMARHLIEAGRWRLAYVDTFVAADFRAHERGKAFTAEARSALQQRAGSPAPDVLAITAPAGDAFDAGRAALHLLLGRGLPLCVDAVAFANDHLACGMLLEAQRLGIAVPGQLALLGFGDFALSRQLADGLSTVQPPRYEIGAEAARTIIDLLALPPGQRVAALAQQRQVAWQLVPRGSTAAALQGDAVNWR